MRLATDAMRRAAANYNRRVTLKLEGRMMLLDALRDNPDLSERILERQQRAREQREYEREHEL